MLTNRLYNEDCLEVLKRLEDNSIDAIVTDPPFGLGFMGKEWDTFDKSQSLYDFTFNWATECLRVIKPGGNLLSFGGTRTYHRMVCAIEDAGWQIRDTIMWVYGSGFPKSLDISKAIDKQKGAERKIVGRYKHPDGNGDRNAKGLPTINTVTPRKENGEWNYSITAPAIPEAKLWEGYGTGLKPAYENILVAQKPLTAVPLYDLMMVIIEQIGGKICQLPSFAGIVANHSVSSQHELNGELDIAHWLVGNNTNTLDILSVLTDTVRLESETNTNWNIVLLWLNILIDLYKMASRFTTSTETALITELKILKSLAWVDIFQNIIHLKSNQINGLSADALAAINLFNVIAVKLNYILTHSAQDPAIFKDAFNDLRPNFLPIVLAMKPLDGTFAENCLKWGVGGLNIDECRIPITSNPYKDGFRKGNYIENTQPSSYRVRANGDIYRKDPHAKGRFPSNFIHDGSQEVMELFPDSRGMSSGGRDNSMFGVGGISKPEHLRGDNGSAARFFYCAKSSRRERDAGLEDMPNDIVPFQNAPARKCRICGHWAFSGSPCKCENPEWEYPEKERYRSRNAHPCVKPLALMEYLVKLVTRPGHIVLDPFLGSGTTAMACKKLGRYYIGCEIDRDYYAICQKRIEAGIC